MAETTIEWTATVGPDGTTHPGFTFNPWEGCSKVHAGCANCYAETRANRFGTAKWGPSGTRRVTSPANWKKPLAWNRKAKELGVRLKVFCASLADVFEDWQGRMLQGWDVDEDGPAVLWHRSDIGVYTSGQPTVPHCRGERLATMDDVRRELFALIDATPHLDWLLLTKRPENIRPMWPLPPKDPWPDCLAWDFASVAEFRSNVWLLTSVSDQASANNQVSTLLECRDLSPVLGLSCEPLLGAIDLSGAFSDIRVCNFDPGIDWVIAGGESGKDARPMHPDWARSLRDQCAAAGVPFFFKQWGEHLPVSSSSYATPEGLKHGTDRVSMLSDGSLCMRDHGPENKGEVLSKFALGRFHKFCTTDNAPDPGYQWMARVGKKTAGRLLDGVEHNGMPTAQLTTAIRKAKGEA